MFPDPNIDALLFELEQRRHPEVLQRLGRPREGSEARHRLRWALGNILLRLGAVVLPDAERRDLRVEP